MATIGVIREINIMMIIRQAGTMAAIREIRIMETTIKKLKSRHGSTDMKILRLLLTVMALLAANGCSMFSSSRNTANDRDHSENRANTDHSSDVNHGVYTGDRE